MVSLKAKIILGIMRHRHILRGKLKKESFDLNIDAVLKFRDTCEKGADRFGKIPAGVTTRQEVINLTLSEWIIPEYAPDGKLIFYIHGGGYVSGSCNDHRSIVAKVVKNTGFTALLYEYGLAPENPFPAALDDSLNVYRAVLDKGYNPEDILVMGESAGGGLSLSLLLLLKEKNIPMPKAAVVISPWTDLSCSGASYKTKNRYSLAPRNSWNVFSHFYVAGNDVGNPYISPLFGSLDGLPPLYINSGNHDELFDDGLEFFHRARKQGVDVIFKEGKGMTHCYPLMAPLFPEATRAMIELADFIKSQLKN